MMNNKKLPFKFLAVFLAVLMVITVIPMGVYAAETEEAEVIQVSELEESRDLYSKIYETSEDTNVIISAAVPLHYEEDGELKDIDNTLVKSETDSSILTNNANAYNVELPKKYTDDSEIKVDYEGNSISFKLINDVKSSKGDIAETEKADVDETTAESVAYAESNLDKLSSSITYSNVIENTDIEYVVEPNQLKENIVINDKVDENYSVSYEFNLGGLNAVKNDDNSISVTDADGKEVYLIESPYMFDANGNISYDISVNFTKTDNAYVLSYTPDYTWLSSNNCVYPVTIDPTVKIDNSINTSIEDTYVSNFYTEDDNSEFDFVQLRDNEEALEYAYYKIKTLPDLKNGYNIIKSSFNLFLLDEADEINEIGNNIALYKVLTDDNIDFSLLNWENKPEISDVFIDADIHNYQNGDALSFDITKLVLDYYTNNRNSLLFALKSIYESDILHLTSCESGENIPFIEIEYIQSSVISNTSSLQTNDMALAGISYINEYSGKQLIERVDFTSNGALGEMIFYYGDSCNVPDNKFLGENTSFNYYKTISKDKFSNNDYILTNGDGSKEYINDTTKYTSYSVNEETGIITLNYNEGIDIIKETYSSTVLNSNANKANEDKVYVLTSCDKSNDKKATQTTNVTISYNSANNRISTIKDDLSTFSFSYTKINNNESRLSSIRKQSLIKSNSNVLSSNKNSSPNSFTCKYSYDNNKYKISKGYINNNNNGNEIIYDQSIPNFLYITNELGMHYKYEYDNLGRIKGFQEFSTDGVAGNNLTFEYGNNTTTISEGKNTYTEYFDLAGNLESIVDQDGNATFAQYKNNLISKVSETRNSARNIADFYGFESSNDSFFKTNDGTVTVSSDTKFNGRSSVQLTTPAQTEAVFRNEISHLESNSTYTVSMWVYKDKNTDCALTLTNGDKSGIFTTVNSQTADGWQQFYCTIDTEDSNNLNIALTVNNSESKNNSTVFVDNMYIQKSPYLTNVNLLQNGDFTDILNNWVTDNSNITLETESANISTADDNKLKITGDYLSEKTISQTVPITATKQGTKYTYGGWIKAVDTLPEKEGTDREISLSVYGITSDGTTSLLDKTTYSSYLSNWQYVESELSLPNDNITQLEFVISNNHQTGYVMFDGLSLSQDELYTTEFIYSDEDGKSIVGIKTNETTIPLVEDTGNTSTSTYEIDTDYQEETINKDGKDTPTGNHFKIVTENATIDDVARKIASKFKYNSDTSLLISELGDLGRWINYKYDYFGNVASVVDANGNEVQYEYDNFQNLSAIINEFESNYISYASRNESTEDDPPIPETVETYTQKVQYTYTGNRLEKIETINESGNTQNKYEFTYDEWNNLKEIKINDAKYIEYEYNSECVNDNENSYYINYTQIKSVSYANGQTINYVYDDNGNIIYEYDSSSDNNYKPTLEYSYYYYDDGTCYGKKDLKAKTIETYQDGLTTVTDYSGNIIHKYGYDTDGNLLEQIGNNYINVNKSTNENSSVLKTTVDNQENVISTEYDDFGRIVSEKLQTSQSKGTASKDDTANDVPSDESTENAKNGSSENYIIKEYTYFENDEEVLNLSDELYKILGLDISQKNVDNITIDPDFDSSRMIRYLTYYLVKADGTKTKLNEYRYLYYPNGNTLSYTLVSGADDIAPGSNRDNVQDIRLYSYNSSNMLTGYIGDFSVDKSDKNILKLDLNSILYDYDENGNIIDVRSNDVDKANAPIKFTYDENSNTDLKNCLTGINLKVSENFSPDFNILYDKSGNINKVSSDNFNVPINSKFSMDIKNVDLNWFRGSTLDSIKGDIAVNYKLPIIDTNVSVPVSLDLFDYKYDDNNLRTNKSINLSLADKLPQETLNAIGIDVSRTNLATADIDYIWRDGLLAGEEINCSGTIFEESNKKYGSGAGKYSIVILYDQDDNAYGFTIKTIIDSEGNSVNKSQTFYYLKDADNTINGIMDEDGEIVVQYLYDSYGMVMGIDNAPGYRYLVLLNPLAYRDYIYDIETGMYYLQSRYYAPYIGRFISADNMLDTSSGTSMCTNLYSYCENNPVNYSDPTGHWAQNYRGFTWTPTGFNLYVNYAFVNKTFCRTYALDILRLKKTLFYKGMSATRMAAELYFHAIVYYATNALTKIGVKNSTIQSWKKSAHYMEINYNDNRVGYFYALWGLSNAVIGRYL